MGDLGRNHAILGMALEGRDRSGRRTTRRLRELAFGITAALQAIVGGNDTFIQHVNL